MTHREKMLFLLHNYASQGRRLADIAGPMGRAISTLKRYCRWGGVSFIDYVPRSMRKRSD